MNQPVRPVYQQPARPQTPVMNQPVRPVYQQPVQSVPQPVRPVYQQPFFVPQPVVRPTQPYTLQAREAISSMNKALFVILSVLFGWICGRSLLSFEYGIGMTALGLSFYLIYLPFIMIKQQKNFSLFGLLLFIPQTIILASLSDFLLHLSLPLCRPPCSPIAPPASPSLLICSATHASLTLLCLS